MARLIQAINRYGPKIQHNPPVALDEVAQWMAQRTGLNKSELMMVVQELQEAILFFNQQGTPVKLPGIGIFSPTMDRQGSIKLAFRPDVALKASLNKPGQFRGRVKNPSARGLTDDAYKSLWDADHPDEPLQL